MVNNHTNSKSSGEITETQLQSAPAADAAGDLAVTNEATESPKNSSCSQSINNSVPSAPQMSTPPDIATDPQVKYLMASAIAGYRLHVMAQSVFNDLSALSEEEKEKLFTKLVGSAMVDANGNPIPFKASDAVAALDKIVLPFWMQKIQSKN